VVKARRGRRHEINARDDVGNPCWSEVLGGIVELYEGGSGGGMGVYVGLEG